LCGGPFAKQSNYRAEREKISRVEQQASFRLLFDVWVEGQSSRSETVPSKLCMALESLERTSNAFSNLF